MGVGSGVDESLRAGTPTAFVTSAGSKVKKGEAGSSFGVPRRAEPDGVFCASNYWSRLKKGAKLS